MKDQVHNLVVAKSILSYIPQGAGVKVSHKTSYFMLHSQPML